MRVTLLLLLICVCTANAALKRTGKESGAIGVQSERGKGKSNIGRSMKKAVKSTTREQIVDKSTRPVATSKAESSHKNGNERKTNKVSYYCVYSYLNGC